MEQLTSTIAFDRHFYSYRVKHTESIDYVLTDLMKIKIKPLWGLTSFDQNDNAIFLAPKHSV